MPGSVISEQMPAEIFLTHQKHCNVQAHHAKAPTAVLAPKIAIQNNPTPDPNAAGNSTDLAALLAAELELAPLAVALALLALASDADALAIAMLFIIDAEAPVAAANPSLVIVLLIMLDEIDMLELDAVAFAAIRAAQEVKFMFPRILFAPSASER